MSASAPAGSVNRNIGRLLATCTIETARGSALRFVISHAEAVSDIAMPVRANVLAIQITAKGAWPNAPQRERGFGPLGSGNRIGAHDKFPSRSRRDDPTKKQSTTSFSSLGARKPFLPSATT